MSDAPTGIDPVDHPALDQSDVYWDKTNEQWVIANKETAYCHLYGPPENNLPLGTCLVWDSEEDVQDVTTSHQYNNYLNYLHYLNELTAYLYVLGYSREQFPGLTIDEIVEKARDVYKYKHGSPSDLASQVYIKRKNIALLRGVRRSYYNIQVTKNGQ